MYPYMKSKVNELYIFPLPIGLRPFPCTYCGKKFGRKDHLKKHTRTHQRGLYNSGGVMIGYSNPFQPFHPSPVHAFSSSASGSAGFPGPANNMDLLSPFHQSNYSLPHLLPSHIPPPNPHPHPHYPFSL